MTWSACIFAHNEERLLPRCVGALDGAAAGGAYVAHILENGSADRTARVARTLAAADTRLSLHELALADKSNAWNDYVHRLAPADAAMHIFIDGDIRPSPGAFKSLAMALEHAPRAYAAAALPMTGRSRRQWATRLFTEHYLSGNLYAMSGAALRIFRERDIRMPVGAVGEDGLLSYILLTDLEGGPDDSHRDRITVAGGAFFEFDSLEANLRDVRIYSRRMRRYSKRHFQCAVLYTLLKREGLAAMPDRVDEIYTTETIAALTPRVALPHYFYDVETLRRLRRCAAAQPGMQ